MSPTSGARGPLQIDLWWAEDDNTVIRITSYELYRLDQLLGITQRLIAADADLLASYGQ